MNDYQIYHSNYIEENLTDIISHINIAHDKFNQLFPNQDSTWTYDRYNIFSLTAPSTFFYNIYKELSTIIKNFCDYDNDLWIQSWVNYLTYDQLNVLDWHGHEFPYHGYISIDPKNTITDFQSYQIHNRSGQIYIGPGYRHHKVTAPEYFDGVRITLGFDVVCNPKSSLVKYTECPWNNMSLIPIL